MRLPSPISDCLKLNLSTRKFLQTTWMPSIFELIFVCMPIVDRFFLSNIWYIRSMFDRVTSFLPSNMFSWYEIFCENMCKMDVCYVSIYMFMFNYNVKKTTWALSMDRNDSLKFVNTNRPCTPFNTSFLPSSDVCITTFFADITTNSPANITETCIIASLNRLWFLSLINYLATALVSNFRVTPHSQCPSVIEKKNKKTKNIIIRTLTIERSVTDNNNNITTSKWYPLWRRHWFDMYVTYLCQNVAGEGVFVLSHGLGHCGCWWSACWLMPRFPRSHWPPNGPFNCTTNCLAGREKN